MTRIPRSDLAQAFQTAVNNIQDAAGPDGIASRADINRELATLDEPERALTGAYYNFVDRWDSGQGSRITRRDLQDSFDVARRTQIDAFDPDNNGISEDEATTMTPLGQLAVRYVQMSPAPHARTEDIKKRYTMYRDLNAFAQLKAEANLRGEPIIEHTSPPSSEAIESAARLTEAGAPTTAEEYQDILDRLRAYDELDPLTTLLRTLGAPDDQAGPLARGLRLSDEALAGATGIADTSGTLSLAQDLLRELGAAPVLVALKDTEALKRADAKLTEMNTRADPAPTTPEEEAALTLYRSALQEANSAEVFIGRTALIHDVLSNLPFGGALDRPRITGQLTDALKTKTALLNALADGAGDLLHFNANITDTNFDMLRSLAIADPAQAERLGPAFFAAVARLDEA
ncbi:MAG: hypothetical protein H6729_16105 [Deltaproteobacteria bacterium]|nr:hypothetical protein [Deltaproteobacteria bacterium]